MRFFLPLKARFQIQTIYKTTTPKNCVFWFYLLYLQFNCTYRKKLEMPTTVPSVLPGPRTHPIKNASFNMELYDTLPFNHSSRQAFYTVKKNQPVFVEVCCLPLMQLFCTLPKAVFTCISYWGYNDIILMLPMCMCVCVCVFFQHLFWPKSMCSISQLSGRLGKRRKKG